MCPYSYYSDINLLCEKTEDFCGYVYYCHKVDKRINTNNWQICKEYNKKEITEGMNEILFVDKNGKLVVQIDKDTALSFDNPYDYVPTEVKIIKDTKGELKIKK